VAGAPFTDLDVAGAPTDQSALRLNISDLDAADAPTVLSDLGARYLT
jgi:hypothetical protein